MMVKRGRGQSWSLDIILAFVVFILIIGIFYTVLNSKSQTKTDTLQLEANTIANNLDSATGINSNFTIMDKSTIDQGKIQSLYSADYLALKNQFGIHGDFCIYLVDQSGNLVTINTSAGLMNGFGNGNLSVNGKPCGSSLS